MKEEIDNTLLYWHCFNVANFLREVGHTNSKIDILNLLKYGAPKEWLLHNNSTPITEWVAEQLGYKYDEEKEIWVR